MAAQLLLTCNPASATPGVDQFNTSCALCHQLNGQGVKGQFPRIAGRLNVIARDPAGREYLARLVLYGMTGRITVDGVPLNGFMPSFGALSDQTLANVLNYVMTLSKGPMPARFTAAEIRRARQAVPLTAHDVYALRAKLEAIEALEH